MNRLPRCVYWCLALACVQLYVCVREIGNMHELQPQRERDSDNVLIINLFQSFNIQFSSSLSVSFRGREFRYTLPSWEAQCYQLPGRNPWWPWQECKWGALHLHRRAPIFAQEGAAWFPAPPGWPRFAVPRHPVCYGPPQLLPRLTLP